jgi:methionyl-tRNA synthetase
MATQRTSFNKLQRDRDKQEKAAAKRDRRQNRATATDEDQTTEALPATSDGASAQELLDEVEKVHRQFDAGVIDFETYENTKTSLLSRLPVD